MVNFWSGRRTFFCRARTLILRGCFKSMRCRAEKIKHIVTPEYQHSRIKNTRRFMRTFCFCLPDQLIVLNIQFFGSDHHGCCCVRWCLACWQWFPSIEDLECALLTNVNGHSRSSRNIYSSTFAIPFLRLRRTVIIPLVFICFARFDSKAIDIQ